jgi:SAM-dependent methyltransferase
LQPRAGEHWLDVATGTGGVALRAARSGARVTGFDVAPRMLEQARRKAVAERLPLKLVEGDGRELPFEDGSFDVVSSCLGFTFHPEDEGAMRELSRVCGIRGRLGIVLWRPQPEFRAAMAPFRAPNAADPPAWTTPERAEELFGDEFSLAVEECTWYLEDESPEALFDFLAVANPATVAFFQKLAPERREAFRRALIDYWRGFVNTDGRVREPNPYLLVIGTRKDAS